MVGGRVVFPMNNDLPHRSQLDVRLSRRTFLNTATAASLTLALPRLSAAAVRSLGKPVRFGVIADLHHDVMQHLPASLEILIGQLFYHEYWGIFKINYFQCE